MSKIVLRSRCCRVVTVSVAGLIFILPLLLLAQDVIEYKQAYDAYKAKNWAAAHKAIDKAVKKDPANRKYLYLKALILLREKRSAEAIRILQKCVSLKPNDYQSLFLLGRLFLKRKDYQKSADSFEQGLAYRPGDYQGSYGLATAYVKLHNYKKAAKVLSKVRGKALNRFQFNYLYGLVLRSLGRYEEAIKYLEKARLLKPEHVQTQLSLADAYQRSGKQKEAMAILKPLLAKKPGNVEALNTLGEAQLGAGDYKAALSTGNKMTVIAANDYRGYMLRARSWQGLNRPEKAVPDLKKVLELDNGGACNAATLLASIYYQRKEFLVAEQYYRRAYKCQRTVTPLLMLGHCYYREGQYDKSLQTYQKVLKLDPNNVEAQQGVKSSKEQLSRKPKQAKK
ncbi:MAG: hypothetical protein DRH70_09250 [Candidatus Coatesbacteria bacterium]|nr:MAG: hypothetical protein DRH70_09250 [Candidatus Coatesbacteria bacterium]